MPAWPARDVRPLAAARPRRRAPPPGPPRPPGPTGPSGPPGGVYPPPPGGAYAPPLAGPPGAPPLPPPLPPPGHYPVPAPPPSRFAPPAVVPGYAPPPQSASADGEAPAPWDEGADDYDTAARRRSKSAATALGGRTRRPRVRRRHGPGSRPRRRWRPYPPTTPHGRWQRWMSTIRSRSLHRRPTGSTGLCPYLLSEDGTSRSSQPDERHRCTAQDPPATLPLAFQERFCLTDRHVRCEMYKVAEDARSQALAQDSIPAEQVRKARFRPTVRSRPVALESSSSAPADPPAAAGPDRQYSSRSAELARSPSSCSSSRSSLAEEAAAEGHRTSW